MKKGLTELVFILDKSGSMSGLEADTIGGYNSMLAKQKAVDGECYITTVLFDNNYELLHDRIDIKAVSPITDKEYQVGGSTALLDAIGRTINKIGNAQKHTAEDYRAEKVMFVIITDVQVRRVDEAGRMKAIASVVFNDVFVVRDIRVIEGDDGRFLAMPSRKLPNGEYRDVAHPITADMREQLTNLVLEKLAELDA
jgi:DNA-binding cell septation regulator SpoVG